MQRQSFWMLWARLISFVRATQNRRSATENMTEISASPILIFIAITLFVVFAILEIELNREQLRALGIIFNNEEYSAI